MNKLPWLALVMVALPSTALAQTEKNSVTPLTEMRGASPISRPANRSRRRAPCSRSIRRLAI